MAEALPLPDGIPALSDADIAPYLDRLATHYINHLAYTTAKKGDHTPADQKAQYQNIKKQLEADRESYKGEIAAQLKASWADFAYSATQNGTDGERVANIKVFHASVFGAGVAQYLAEKNIVSSGNQKFFILSNALLGIAKASASYGATPKEQYLNYLFNEALMGQWLDARSAAGANDTKSAKKMTAEEKIKRTERQYALLRSPCGVILSEAIYTLSQARFEESSRNVAHGRSNSSFFPEDLTHETQKLFRMGLFRFDPGKSELLFSDFCNRFILTHLPKILRNHSRIIGEPLDGIAENSVYPHTPSVVDSLIEQTDSTALRAQADIRIEALRGGIERLPPLQRDALKARYSLNGITIGEIAERDHASHQAITRRADRAEGTLRRVFGNQPPRHQPEPKPKFEPTADQLSKIQSLREKITTYFMVEDSSATTGRRMLTVSEIAHATGINPARLYPLLIKTHPWLGIKRQSSLADTAVDRLAEFLSEKDSAKVAGDFRTDMLELRTLTGYRARGESERGGVSP
jgi:hypothetical protein